MLTPDLLFSYWLFLWYVLYLLNIIKYSPKIWFIIALFYIVIATIYIYKKVNNSFILLFLCIAFFVKVVPLYTIRKDKYNLNDFLFGILLIFIYLVWITYRKMNIIKIYTVDLFNGQSPIIYIMNKIL
uniref:Uncharacterized protein n=1 Tax=viral metagenome TaxID=1070528 RepID=A0A6C0ET52_9ZZZZ